MSLISVSSRKPNILFYFELCRVPYWLKIEEQNLTGIESSETKCSYRNYCHQYFGIALISSVFVEIIRRSIFIFVLSSDAPQSLIRVYCFVYESVKLTISSPTSCSRSPNCEDLHSGHRGIWLGHGQSGRSYETQWTQCRQQDLSV